MRCGMPFISDIVCCLDGTFAATPALHPERAVYYGFKHNFSTVLILAVCDSSLRFRWISANKPGSFGDQAVMIGSDLNTSSCDPDVRKQLHMMLDSWLNQAEPDDACASSSSSASGSPAAAAASAPTGTHTGVADVVRATVPPGYVIVADGGLTNTSYLLRVTTEAAKLAIKRAHPDDADVAKKLEYYDYVVSSSRIHVERAFGRLFGMFRRLRLQRTFPTVTTELIVATSVIHNHIIVERARVEKARVSEATATAAPRDEGATADDGDSTTFRDTMSIVSDLEASDAAFARRVGKKMRAEDADIQAEADNARIRAPAALRTRSCSSHRRRSTNSTKAEGNEGQPGWPEC